MISRQRTANSTHDRLCVLRFLVGLVVPSVALALADTRALAAERAWTRTEILAIADREAQQVGYRTEQWGVSVDLYNSMWIRYTEMVMKESVKGEVIHQIEAKLNGRSIWAVSYRSPLDFAAKTFGLFVFIDRDSGEVIGSFVDDKWQEGMQRPTEDRI